MGAKPWWSPIVVSCIPQLRNRFSFNGFIGYLGGKRYDSTDFAMENVGVGAEPGLIFDSTTFLLRLLPYAEEGQMTAIEEKLKFVNERREALEVNY